MTQRGALVFLMVYVSISWTSGTRQLLQTNKSCKTPDNDFGSCISIYKCQPILDIINSSNQIDDYVANFLRRYSCGYDNDDSPKVCCPSKPIVIGERNQHPNLNLLPSDCGNSNPLHRITNGEEASLHEFPWQAALKYNSKWDIPFHCGGSLINNRYVLTAAHCITTNLNLVGVRLGEHDFGTEKDCVQLFKDTVICAEPPQDFVVSKKDTIVHAGYSRTALHNDIALIRLPREVKFSDSVGPVCLPINANLMPKQFNSLIVVGWGKTEKVRGSSVLMKVSVPYQDNSVCEEAFKNQAKISDKQLCAGGTEGKDSCNGDSGGPIMSSVSDDGLVRVVQVGLVSFGATQCGKERVPGVYTRLTSYTDWILDNIKP